MTARKGAIRPEKPRPDFPLTPHACGQWVKKIHGKVRHFGPWEDPEGSLAEYERQREFLHGGGDAVISGLTVRQLCNLFLAARESKLDDGDLSRSTWNDYKKTAKRLVAFFGPTRSVASLSPQDFRRFRKSWPKSWGPVTINNQIVRLSAILNFALKEGLVDQPVTTGTALDRVEQKKLDIDRAVKDEKFFEADEIHQLLAKSGTQLRAMIMLGINAGYGPADCGRLTKDQIAGEWLSSPREKTGVWRMAWLWPETREAIDVALAMKRPKDAAELSHLAFLTKFGKPWWEDGSKRTPIGQEFTKARKAAKLFRKGVGFYSLRHVTQTIGEQSTSNPLVIKILMGHKDNSISARYRERFDPQPIREVCEKLRDWWLAGKQS